MEVIPAIDLMNGGCVRLYKGDFDQVTEYDQDPLDSATRYYDAGSARLHLVDLDVARAKEIGEKIGAESATPHPRTRSPSDHRDSVAGKGGYCNVWPVTCRRCLRVKRSCVACGVTRVRGSGSLRRWKKRATVVIH